MDHLNVEIKAHCPDPEKIRNYLESKDAEHRGTDHQVDTYFYVPDGRLKLREGTIENHLIFYRRPDRKQPGPARIHLHPTEPDSSLKPLLEEALGTRVQVKKKRDIYFIKNVKFHIDEVRDLGSFMEIEAIDRDGNKTKEQLRQQCQTYLDDMPVSSDDLISRSYADLLRAKREESES